MYPLGTWFASGTYELIPYIKEIKIIIVIIKAATGRFGRGYGACRKTT